MEVKRTWSRYHDPFRDQKLSAEGGNEGIFTGGSFYFGDHTSRFLEFDISETRLEFGISDGTQTAFHPGSISIYNKNDAKH